MFKERFYPLMAEEGGSAGGGSGNDGNSTGNTGENGENSFQFDYEKLASIVAGKQSVTEDSVLKGYFKQQGLSADEMKAAVKAFKDEKAKNTPDVQALTKQVERANANAVNAEIKSQALLMAGELGVDLKTMPYVIKLADMSNVTSEGKIDAEKLKESLQAVLNNLPQLKNDDSQNRGFRVIGGTGTDGRQGADDAALEKAFGIKLKK